jgi:2-aminoadipate transaminase
VSNPIGIDGVAGRRHRLLASGVPLIVDEAYAELRFDGRLQQPLLAQSRERVWHVGTLSKTLSPGLRVGWLVPPRSRREEVLERKHAADLQASSLAQAAAAALLDELDYDAHVERVRRAYAARCEVMVGALRRRAPDTWRWVEPAGGFSVWIEVGAEVDEAALLDHAIRNGVCFDPGRLFRPDDAEGGLAFRLSFSSAPPGSLSEGVRRLVAAVSSFREDQEARHVRDVQAATAAVDR